MVVVILYGVGVLVISVNVVVIMDVVPGKMSSMRSIVISELFIGFPRGSGIFWMMISCTPSVGKVQL